MRGKGRSPNTKRKSKTVGWVEQSETQHSQHYIRFALLLLDFRQIVKKHYRWCNLVEWFPLDIAFCLNSNY